MVRIEETSVVVWLFKPNQISSNTVKSHLWYISWYIIGDSVQGYLIGLKLVFLAKFWEFYPRYA